MGDNGFGVSADLQDIDLQDLESRLGLRLGLADVVRAVAAAAPAADATGAFPWDGIDAVHRSGLLETTVGARYGGTDISLGDVTRTLALLGRGDPSVALIAAMTLFAHRQQAQRGLWPEDSYRSLLAETKDRVILLNAARVEPALGSPARGGLPDTLARRTPRGWSVTGTKRFVTGAAGLTHFLVWARTDEEPARVGTFVVRGDDPGIRIVENWKSLGMRATGSHDVVFTDVEVPRGDVIGLVDAVGGEQDNLINAAGNLALTAIYLGAARAAQAAFTRFAHERVPANLGKSLARTERFITLAGEIDLLVSGAQQLIFNAIDHAQDRPDHLMRARLLAGRQLRDAVQIAVRALGNPGLSGNLELERHFRDIQSVLVHAPQEDVVTATLGRAALAASPGLHQQNSRAG